MKKKIVLFELIVVNTIAINVFSQSVNGQNHCQVGNIGLTLDTMLKWIEEDELK